MKTKLSGLLVAALIGLTTAGGGQALELCAKADRRGDPSQPKDGSPIRARSECKAGKEVSVGTTEGLADTAAVLSLVAENTAAIELKADQTAVDDKADRQAVEANTGRIERSEVACTVGECARSCFITGLWFADFGTGGNALGEDVQGNFQFRPGGESSIWTGTITGNSFEMTPPGGGVTCSGTISGDCSEIEITETFDCPALTLTPTSVLGQCGNGVVDAGEWCDDGNLVDGDGCNVVPSCTLSP